MTSAGSKLSLDFYNKKPLEVQFSGLDLSSDAGLLLIRQAEEKIKICEGMAHCLGDNRDQSKVKHPLSQLISQRVYQIAAGYEDSNDSNYLRHDPIFKIGCDKIPLPGEELLANQPTMSRWENRVSKKEIKAIRWLFWRLKRAWPKVKIILRGDAGFSLPELIKICERSEVTYAFDFTSNAVQNAKN